HWDEAFAVSRGEPTNDAARAGSFGIRRAGRVSANVLHRNARGARKRADRRARSVRTTAAPGAAVGPSSGWSSRRPLVHSRQTPVQVVSVVPPGAAPVRRSHGRARASTGTGPR